MKKLEQILGKSVFEKRSGKEGSPRPPVFRGATLGEFLDVFYFIGRSGEEAVSPAAPKSFVHAETAFIPAARRARRISARPETASQIGGAPSRALSPRRWGKQHGRSMIEMLAVLAISFMVVVRQEVRSLKFLMMETYTGGVHVHKKRSQKAPFIFSIIFKTVEVEDFKNIKT